MSTPQILSTVVDYTRRGLQLRRLPRTSAGVVLVSSEGISGDVDPEFRLPKRRSLINVFMSNVLLQLAFYSIVPSSSLYAEYLGGTSTFSGLTIGIPTVFSALALIPMTRLDGGRYAHPLNISCAAALLGSVLYALAYRAKYLYLILLGRIVLGFAFTFFLYTKRFCADPRMVGIRRRTTLAGWLVVGQGFGFTAGPFLGGVLFKIGFSNAVFNGYTSPGWIMAVAFAIFWAISLLTFSDVPSQPADVPIELEPTQTPALETLPPTPSSEPESGSVSSSTVPAQLPSESSTLSVRQWGVLACMMWYQATGWFTLSAWEVNIPVYSAAAFGWSPFKAGNFIALGGIASFPFLCANVWLAPRMQDRHILASGASIGILGEVLMMVFLTSSKVTFGSYLFCWFFVALGFNLTSTVTFSLLTKQLPGKWYRRGSLFIEYSATLGRSLGSVWGGAGVEVGMTAFLGLQVGMVGLAGLVHYTLWRDLKSKMG